MQVLELARLMTTVRLRLSLLVLKEIQDVPRFDPSAVTFFACTDLASMGQPIGMLRTVTRVSRSSILG